MNTRLVALATITVLALGGATGCGATREDRQRDQADAAPPAAPGETTSGPRIVFRHTGLDQSYGMVATVALDDPGGPPALTDVACDRVAAWDGGASCLVTERGVETAYEAHELDADWQVTQTHPLAGPPSRTRVSPDGTLVATTSFVTGHSYESTEVSTETVVREVGGGTDWGNLEDFDLAIEGRPVDPPDLNVWGVTFADDDRFYASVSTDGRTWLVEGDLSARTLTSVTDGAECPSLSPDGSRVAYKIDVDPGGDTVWGLAVLDLATGERTDLSGGPRGVDDQVAWLDDDTLLYGLPRQDEPGVTDVWSLDTTPDATPEVLIEEAWSPTVVP